MSPCCQLFHSTVKNWLVANFNVKNSWINKTKKNPLYFIIIIAIRHWIAEKNVDKKYHKKYNHNLFNKLISIKYLQNLNMKVNQKGEMTIKQHTKYIYLSTLDQIISNLG